MKKLFWTDMISFICVIIANRGKQLILNHTRTNKGINKGIKINKGTK